MKTSTIEAARKRGGQYIESADMIVVGPRGDDEVRIEQNICIGPRYRIGRYRRDNGAGAWIGQVRTADSIQTAMDIACDMAEGVSDGEGHV